MLLVITSSLFTASLAIALGVLVVRSLCRRRRHEVSIATVVEKANHQKVGPLDTKGFVLSPGTPIPTAVTDSDTESIERSQWVLRMTRHIFKERHRCKFNVVVINQELEYHFDAEGVIERHHLNYYEGPKSRKVPYEITVFERGVLYNMGDGGDINWDWMGNFTRNGKSMLTFKPCEEDVAYVQDPWVPSVHVRAASS